MELFQDYFVLLPEDYYLASILHQKIEKPCKINDTNSLCREYSYPNLTQFDTVACGFGTAVFGSTQRPISEFYEDLKVSYENIHVGHNFTYPFYSTCQWSM